MDNGQTSSEAIESIPLDKLVAHPDNPNEMSKVNFAKLVRNIERTGRYEPLVVRPTPKRSGFFQIINGHHRRRALAKLGYERADVVVWEIDDGQTDILLATLNRLGGADELGKKLRLLERLNKRVKAAELAKLLPLKQNQIERLVNLKKVTLPVKVGERGFATPLVFFVNDRQQKIIEEAILSAAGAEVEETGAARKAAALTHIAEYFLDRTVTG